MKKVMLICMGIILLLLLGYVGQIIYYQNQTTFYRTEEVAIADDKEIQTDNEGRIFVSNPYKEKMKGEPSYAKVKEEQEKNPEIIADEETQVESSVAASIAVENAKIELKNTRHYKELQEDGNKEMQKIIDEKIEEENKKLQEQKEKEKALQEEKKKKLIEQSLTGVDDLRSPSNLTALELEKGLKNGLKGLGEYFIEAENTYGVNAIFLASVAALESAWGTSNYAVKRNNLFGYGAYTSNPDHAYYFSSKRVAILYVAQKLKNDYLTLGGSFFNGYTLTDVNKKYCTNPQWANLVSKIMKEIRQSSKNL